MTAQQKPQERKAFKLWFDDEAAKTLALQVAGAWPQFDQQRFVELATQDLESQEFAGRVGSFAGALAATLPDAIDQALAILTASLPSALRDCEAVTDGWLQWPVGQFIADHGLQHFDESMTAMIELTQRFSAEFAVRPFVEQHPEATFERLQALTSHASPHVRRWCSEGTRPRLPWGKKLRALMTNPSPIWPILEALKDDEELYVRKSVANNLNDIAKDHPEAVVERCQEWSREADEQRSWVIKQGLRSLIKAGDPGALAVVGFGPPQQLTATLEIEPQQITIGESVELSATLTTTAQQPQQLLVDYRILFVRQRGKVGGKVFKWTQAELPAQGCLELTKRHAMKKTTVRALYPGEHEVELQVNGVNVARSSFRLL